MKKCLSCVKLFIASNILITSAVQKRPVLSYQNKVMLVPVHIQQIPISRSCSSVFENEPEHMFVHHNVET